MHSHKISASFEENDKEVENQNGRGLCDISFHINKVKHLPSFSKFLMFIMKKVNVIFS